MRLSSYLTYTSALLLLLAFVFVVVSGSTSNLAGIHPNEIARYKSAQFRCNDYSKTIDASQVNDNYCDCADGSDEPGTSACANGRFWCRNRGHIGKYIPSSMVHDNICDCCDASDELPGVCESDCASQGLAQRLDMQKQLRAIREGLRVRTRWEEESLETYQSEVIDRKDQLTKEMQDAEKRLAEYQEIVNNMEPMYNEAEKVLHPADNNDNNNGEAQAQDQAEPTGEEIENDTKEFERIAEIERAAQEFRIKHGLSPKDVIKAYEKAELDTKPIQKEVDEYKNEIRKLDDILKLDLNGGRFHKHYGQIVQYSTNEYTYTLNLFKSVEQSGTRLGDFEGWQQSGEYKVMKYTRGQYCWGGPDRSTMVKLVCGASNEIKSVEEPAKCEYSMVFATPYACDPQEAKDLELALAADADITGNSDIV